MIDWERPMKVVGRSESHHGSTLQLFLSSLCFYHWTSLEQGEGTHIKASLIFIDIKQTYNKGWDATASVALTTWSALYEKKVLFVFWPCSCFIATHSLQITGSFSDLVELHKTKERYSYSIRH